MHLLKCSVSDSLDLKVLFVTNPAPYDNHHLQPSLTKAHFLDKHDAFCSKGLKIRAAYLQGNTALTVFSRSSNPTSQWKIITYFQENLGYQFESLTIEQTALKKS